LLDCLAPARYTDDVPVGVLDPDLDRIFHALADPGRRLMVKRLSQGPASVSELGRPLAMTLAAVLQHVQVLEESGLVRSEKNGRTRTCTLDARRLRSAEHWISQRRELVERRLDRLGEHLAATADQPGGGPESRSISRGRSKRGGTP
jgi:DNA-binding transcriptional ArsR family regulator